MDSKTRLSIGAQWLVAGILPGSSQAYQTLCTVVSVVSISALAFVSVDRIRCARSVVLARIRFARVGRCLAVCSSESDGAVALVAVRKLFAPSVVQAQAGNAEVDRFIAVASGFPIRANATMFQAAGKRNTCGSRGTQRANASIHVHCALVVG